MKTDLIYSNETLFVYLEGRVNRRGIKLLKNKINNIIAEYQINDIIIDTKHAISSPYMDEFLRCYRQ